MDVSALQRRLDAVDLRVDVDALVLRRRARFGTEPDPLLLVLAHGWPWSFPGHLDLLPVLTDPQARRERPGTFFRLGLGA